MRRRKSIDVLKEMFRDELSKDDWRLVIKLKKVGGARYEQTLGGLLTWQVGVLHANTGAEASARHPALVCPLHPPPPADLQDRLSARHIAVSRAERCSSWQQTHE